jgi:hypothetical protein
MDAETIACEPLPVQEDLSGRRKKPLWSVDEVGASPAPPTSPPIAVVSPHNRWPWQDRLLRDLVESKDCKSWRDVAMCIGDRTEVDCFRRWQKVVNPNLKKGGWTPEEDRKIIELVARFGAKKWSLIASHLPGRIDKQCRERWVLPPRNPNAPPAKGLS